MTSPKKDVAAGYGEGDIEAKAMTDASKGKLSGKRATSAPPRDTLMPTAGTTESDIGKNLREKADRENKS